jgi:hypothetical protein
MKVRLISLVILLVTGMVVGELFRPFQTMNLLAAQSCRTFTETGKQVCGRFLEYWQQNGGLAQQGLPLSSEFSEVSDLNGRTYTVQYFERAVFEKHPENTRPHDVLLSQLGTFQFKRKYPTGDPSQPTARPVNIIGQTIEYAEFSGKARLRATVTDVKEAAVIPAGSYEEARAKGKYVIVFLSVTNIGLESGDMASDVALKDSRGRTFDQADTSVLRNAADQYNLPVPYETIQPGITDNTLVVFDVAPDASGYVLVPER